MLGIFLVLKNMNLYCLLKPIKKSSAIVVLHKNVTYVSTFEQVLNLLFFLLRNL